MAGKVVMVMVMVVLVVMLLAGSTNAAANMDCPRPCQCKWIDGKQTAMCDGSNGGVDLSTLNPITQVLHINRTPLSELPDHAFSSHGLTHLQKVFLPDCGIRHLAPLALEDLTNLVELDLSYNLLISIPAATFEFTPELRHLHLSHNLITDVSESSLLHLTSLRHLDLSHCRLKTIAATAFRPLRHLRKLFIQNNQLTELLPQLVGSLRHLHEMNLHKNPWHCDCRLRRLRQWLSKHPVYSEPPQCSTPARLEGHTFNELGEEQFACQPEILHTDNHGVVMGGNVTLWCPVGGLPTPTVTWYVNDQQVRNGSLQTSSEDYDDSDSMGMVKTGGDSMLSGVVACIRNEATEERGSLLSLSGLEPRHSKLSVRCVATNAAGTNMAEFTLEVIAGITDHITPEIVAATVTVSILIVLGCIAICAMIKRRRRRRYGHTPIPVKPIINGGDNRNSLLPYTPSTYVGGSVMAPTQNPDLIKQDNISSGEEDEDRDDDEAAGCISTDEGEILSGGWRAGVHSRSLDEGSGKGWMWEPRRALAVLDSAAPEHVMLRQSGTSLSSSQHRLSLLPQFAPDYSQLFFTPGPQTTPLVTTHYGTVPRSTRVRQNPTPPNPTLSPTPTRLPPMTSPPIPHDSPPAPCPPRPHHNSPPTPCPPHPHHTKLDRITARDSPDEGYQEGAEV